MKSNVPTMTRDEAMKVVREALLWAQYQLSFYQGLAGGESQRAIEAIEKCDGALSALPFIQDAAGAVGGAGVVRGNMLIALGCTLAMDNGDHVVTSPSGRVYRHTSLLGIARRIGREFIDALKPIENSGGVGVPVAWQVLLPSGAVHSTHTIKQDAESYSAWADKKLKTIPLYASPPPPATQPFQSRVNDWMQVCFGPEISADKMERNHRFIEEALELVQSNGCTQSEAHQLVDYVYGRPVGELPQEVGGVMVTLAALCLASNVEMEECGEIELARVWTKVEKIRAKQAAKPKHSPLPEHAPAKQPDPRNEQLRLADELAEAARSACDNDLNDATYELEEALDIFRDGRQQGNAD